MQKFNEVIVSHERRPNNSFWCVAGFHKDRASIPSNAFGEMQKNRIVLAKCDSKPEALSVANQLFDNGQTNTLTVITTRLTKDLKNSKSRGES